MYGVAEYVVKSLEYEQYAFSWEELKSSTSKTDAALKSELARLVQKKEIVNLRQGFYLILPPRYRSFGKLPIKLYVEKLFNCLKKPYYIAFYSAASFHDANHQQIQKDYIITQIPNIRDIRKKSFHLSFFAATTWPEKNIIRKKSDAGYFNISSPALTSIDLIHYQSKLGGINRMLAILEELIEELKLSDMQDLLSWYPHTSAIQRLGFLLEELQADKAIIDILKVYLKQRRFYPVLLSPRKDAHVGKTGNLWRVNVNVKPESDL